MARSKVLLLARRYDISGQSVVIIDGKNFYLGPHNEAKTLTRYAVLIQAYQENGSKLPDGFSDDWQTSTVRSYQSCIQAA